MKNIFKIIPIVVVLCVLTSGCGSIFHENKGVIGKASIAEDKASTKIESVQKSIDKTSDSRLTHIGAWAEGTDYSLAKSTNDDLSIFAAKETNQRVIALANKPDYKELQAVYDIIDNLLTNQTVGLNLLAKKDKDIVELQNNITALNNDKQNAIKNYMFIADKNAALADQYKTTLGDYRGWLGLKAVFLGLKQFITSSIIILGICGILFVLLRILSMSNPIAASIFSIFSVIGGWFISIIKLVTPKAINEAKLVTQELYNQSTNILNKIVDNIQNIKQIESKTGKDITLRELLDEFDKSLDSEEKTTINNIKKQLGY